MNGDAVVVIERFDVGRPSPAAAMLTVHARILCRSKSIAPTP